MAALFLGIALDERMQALPPGIRDEVQRVLNDVESPPRPSPSDPDWDKR